MNRRGFTLIEVLLSTMIVGVALIILATVFYQGTASIAEMKELSIATLSAEKELEIIRDMSFDSILALVSPRTFTVTGLKNPSGSMVIDNPYSTDDMRRVSVTVAWTSMYGKSLSKSLVTLVTRKGINRK